MKPSLISLFVTSSIVLFIGSISYSRPAILSGNFICRINIFLMYTHTDDDGEYPLFALKAVNTKTNENILIDSLESEYNCVKISDSALVYAKGNKLYLWNANTKKKAIFNIPKNFSKIIGISFNQKNKYLLLIDVNYDSNKLLINVFDERKNIVFKQQISFNVMEIEGIYPKIGEFSDYFVFRTQDQLYFMDLSKAEPALKLLTDKCDEFALNESGILYYKFVSDEKKEGYFYNIRESKTNKIDNQLKAKLYGCINSILYTAKIENKMTPVYLICDSIFNYSDFKWHAISDAIIYKDDKIIVKYPYSQKKINESFFEWNQISN